MKKVLIALVAILSLAACGDTLDGEVTKKDVRPGYTYVMMQPIYTTSCSGNPSVCTTRVSSYIPIPMRVPDCYRLYVKNGSKKRHGCVDRKRWGKVQVGEHYTGKDLGKRATKDKKA